MYISVRCIYALFGLNINIKLVFLCVLFMRSLYIFFINDSILYFSFLKKQYKTKTNKQSNKSNQTPILEKIKPNTVKKYRQKIPSKNTIKKKPGKKKIIE